MIVVLGRPRVERPEPDGDLVPAGLAAAVAMAVARAGAEVELVGSVGDDPEGDGVVVSLGRAGVGHAALLRDPTARTPRTIVSGERRLPRLEAADIELGLRYVPRCRVIVMADPLGEEARSAALEAAAYHGAAAVIIAPPGTIAADELGDEVTLLEAPETEEDAGLDPDAEGADAGSSDAAARADHVAPFAAFVADYALRLDRGESAETAFTDALGGGAWEASPD